MSAKSAKPAPMHPCGEHIEPVPSAQAAAFERMTGLEVPRVREEVSRGQDGGDGDQRRDSEKRISLPVSVMHEKHKRHHEGSHGCAGLI